MKTKMILMLVFLLSIGNVTAVNATSINDDSSVVQMEIQKILKKHPHKFAIEEDYVVSIEITLNDKNEIVVLEMDCEDKEITRYIKNTLNYKKIKGKLQGELSKYVIPLRFKRK